MPRLNNAPPIRFCKISGQAIVRLGGKKIYLGRAEPGRIPPDVQANYDRVVADYLAARRGLGEGGRPLTVAELADRFDDWAASEYRDTGRVKEYGHLRGMLKMILKHHHAATYAADFGPLALKAVRADFIAAGWTRTYCNQQGQRVCRMFKWAAGEQLVPVEVYHALRAVEGLRRGRSAAREGEKVRPVADIWVDAALPHMPPPVAALVRLQRLTGARGGELLNLRTRDVDTSGEVWEIRPAEHKSANYGFTRTIYVGPRGQEVLRPLLLADLDAPIFSPRQAVEAVRTARRAARKTRPAPRQRRRKLKARPKRTAGMVYTADSYRRAIVRACDTADRFARLALTATHPERFEPCQRCAATGIEPATARTRCRVCDGIGREVPRQVPRWHPHQLRHSAATEIRRELGVEAARIALGHRHISTSELYAETDAAVARAAALRLG